jgi:hypothetical protein
MVRTDRLFAEHGRAFPMPRLREVIPADRPRMQRVARSVRGALRPSAGLYFQRGCCQWLMHRRCNLTLVRGWDFAATPKTKNNDPD